MATSSGPTLPAGSRLLEAPAAACRSQPDNLIAFPRLRSITPRRRQNEALKGPAAPPCLPQSPPGTGRPLGKDWPPSSLAPPGCVAPAGSPTSRSGEWAPLERGLPGGPRHCRPGPHCTHPHRRVGKLRLGARREQIAPAFSHPHLHSAPQVPRGPLGPASPSQAQATCPRIYTNALSNPCPCRARRSTAEGPRPHTAPARCPAAPCPAPRFLLVPRHPPPAPRLLCA